MRERASRRSAQKAREKKTLVLSHRANIDPMHPRYVFLPVEGLSVNDRLVESITIGSLGCHPKVGYIVFLCVRIVVQSLVRPKSISRIIIAHASRPKFGKCRDFSRESLHQESCRFRRNILTLAIQPSASGIRILIQVPFQTMEDTTWKSHCHPKIPK